MVEKVISSNEAKQRWGAVMETVAAPDGVVVVESHGKPKVAVISYERYQQLRELEVQRNREIGLKALRDIEASYDGRNDDLTEDEITELAVRAVREVRQERRAAERDNNTSGSREK